jgi:hypothetical protein
MWCATTTAGSGHASSTVTRRDRVIGGSAGMSRGTARAGFGMRPKYFSTSDSACAGSTSPAMVSVQFEGT